MQYLKLLAFLIFFSSISFSVEGQDDKRHTEAYFQVEAKFIAARGEQQKGNLEKAIELYKECLIEPSAKGAVEFEISRIYDKLDRNEEALAAAKKAVEAETGNQFMMMHLAEMYQKTGNDKACAETYSSLQAQFPNDEYYYYKSAYFWVRANQPQKAVKIYEGLEKKIGVNPELARRKQLLHLGLGDTKQAEKEILKLVNTYPNDLEYRHFLASFYEQTNNKNKAKATYQYILEQDPTDTQAIVALAEDKKIDTGDANYLQSLKPMFEDSEMAIDAKIAQIIPFIQQVANKEDKQLANEVLELSQILETAHPAEAKAYSISGDLYYYTNRKTEAIDKYETTLKYNKSVYLVWEQYLYALVETKQWSKLLTRSEDALDVFPNQGRIHLFNGIAYGRQEKHAQALNSLQQASMISFKNPPLTYDVLVEMGEQNHYLKKYDKSDQHFQKAIDLNPQGSPALARYAYFLALRNENIDQAEKISKKAVELTPNTSDFEASLAMVYYAKKDYKKALEWYTKAIENMTYVDALILENHGDALFQNSDVENAVLQWQKALDAGGKASRLNKKITDKALGNL